MAENDARLQVLNTLLTTPHRDLDALWPLHADMVKRDPRFYPHLAAWYFDKGEVRDHKEVFVAALSLSDFPGHRDVGLALLRRLPPYEVARVVDFIHGDKKADEKNSKKKGKKDKRKKVHPRGLFKNIPRSFKTEVERYIREREAEPETFDMVALHGRKVLKRLYALLHIKPGERAQKIIFDDEPPPDSKLAALKTIARMEDPAAQARAIVDAKIPFRIAVGAIKGMTPSVMVAMVNAMSGQELVNHVASLRKHGAFDDPGLKALIEERLEAAAKDGRVQAFKAEVAADAAGAQGELRSKLVAIADARTKAKGRIKRATALLCDKSGSMGQAIEVSKRLGSLIASLTDAPLFCYAFDGAAWPIETGDDRLESWEKAFLGITADGNTSAGAPLQAMRKKKQAVEQIVLVTDEGENTAPFFVNELRRYQEELGCDPQVLIVRVGNATPHLQTQIAAAGWQVDVFPFSGDYYALPNVIPFLLAPSRVELVLEILEYPLPKRELVPA
ncbi:MAG TPA: hypothetical protein VFF73_11640 [Planctomycetota bacterium]|nr:hypothetical protein [Planctomycetota bacterium]